MSAQRRERWKAPLNAPTQKRRIAQDEPGDRRVGRDARHVFLSNLHAPVPAPESASRGHLTQRQRGGAIRRLLRRLDVIPTRVADGRVKGRPDSRIYSRGAPNGITITPRAVSDRLRQE